MKPKQKRKKVSILLCGLIVYTASSILAGCVGYLSWQLIIASALPDSVAIYFGVIALQMTKTLEYHNAHIMKQLTNNIEDILTYLQAMTGSLETETKKLTWDK